MTKIFKNGPSLHRLLDNAPVIILLQFCKIIDEGVIADAISDIHQSPDELTSDDDVRELLFNRIGQLDQEVAARIDNHAQRIVTLGEGRGVEALSRVIESRLEDDARAEYDAQQDALGRSVWAYLRARRHFDDAESLFYANHYRNYGKMYDAFELASDATAGFVWSADLQAALEERIVEKLELKGRCSVTYLLVPGAGDKGDAHMLIVRHGGPLSSVAEHKDDGGKCMHYYRPPNEATLMFMPEEGMVEICAESPGVKQHLAACFAEVGLGHDLSEKPLTLKQYKLSRFFDSLALPLVPVDGFDIARVAVVEIYAKPNNPRHRASLKVTVNDDIEDVARRLFGSNHIFSRASVISRVVIAVRYTRHGETKTKTLNITLSDPNRCNLRSNQDPVQRELGFALLDKWEILTLFRRLGPDDERTLFPTLLSLFDQMADDFIGQFFLERGLDVAALADSGFVERRGRDTTILIDDEDGGPYEAEVQSAGKPGYVRIESPVDGRPMEVPSHTVEKYRINRAWLDEVILKQLLSYMTHNRLSHLDNCLTYLGEINLDGSVVPCYVARGLGDSKVLRNLDALLRARSEQGVGIVLAASADGPLCLGCNVVAPICEHLSLNDDSELLSMESLSAAFVRNRQMARGGMAVELAKNGSHTATLYIPGKPPYTVTGANQINILERLVVAHQNGSPAVLTSDLIVGTSVRSPSQAFRDWKEIVNVYIGQAGKRGSWQLLA